jgi:SAM-dependent methyltransferase
MKPYYLRLDHEMLAWAVLQRTAVRRLDLMYSELIEYDMALLRPFLPDEVENVLDIGCGIAAIDARLFQQYPDAHFWLLDKSALYVEYGQETDQVFYNSLQSAWKLMTMNGVPVSQIDTLEANENYEIPMEEPVDLVLSLFAWGWHFSLERYIDEVIRLTLPGALLIIDMRNDAGEEELLRAFDMEHSVKLLDGERRFYRRRDEA